MRHVLRFIRYVMHGGAGAIGGKMGATNLVTEAEALVEQGIAAYKAGDREKAKTLFRRSTEIDPANEAPWLWLASLYNDLQVVSHCLQQALLINPTNRQAAQVLQTVMRRLYDPDMKPSMDRNDGMVMSVDAGTLQEHAVRQSEEGMVVRSLDDLKKKGIAAAKSGRKAEARGFLIAATEANDSDAEAWYWLSTVVDDPADKRVALENALTLDPNHEAASDALGQLTETYNSDNDTEESDAYASTQSIPTAASHEGIAVPAIEPAAPQRPVLASKLFARPGTLAGSTRTGSSHVTDSGHLIIAGKYTLLGTAPSGEGDKYIVCDVDKRRFYYLERIDSEADNTSHHKEHIIYNSFPYAVVPIETDGLNLRDLISKVGLLPAHLVAQYGLAMLETMAAEHEHGPILTSRQYITPDTVYLDAKGQMLLDGPTRQFSTPFSSSMVLPFLPTEQVEDGTLTPNSDIFAVGAILLFMMTGFPPPDPSRMPKKQGGRIVPRRFDQFPYIPEDMTLVIATALQPNPSDRYSSAAEMADALRATGAGQDANSAPPYIGWAVVAVAVCLLTALGIYSIGKLQDLKLFPLNLGENRLVAQVSPTEVSVVAATPLPDHPFSKLIVNSVDSRRFPAGALYFSALDSTGAPVPGIADTSVKLRESAVNVKALRMEELRKTTDQISVIIALDTSDKMTGKPFDDAKTAIHIFADAIQPGDRLALLTFGGSAQMVLNYTVSKGEFLSALDKQQASGASALQDTFGIAATQVMSQVQGGLTALVVVSNSPLPSDKQALDSVVRTVRGVNIPVYFVVLDRTAVTGDGIIQLAGVSSATGGQTMVAEAADAGGAAAAISRIEKQLHNTYKLSFESPSFSPEAAHTLELSITVGGVTQSDTRTYYVWPSVSKDFKVWPK